MLIFVLFILALFGQQIYHLFVFARIAFYSQPNGNYTEQLPLSLIICCKNEKENLEKNLPAILSQDYTDFEVCIIDDASTDDTDVFIKQLQLQFPNRSIRYVSVNKSLPGKKELLHVGIKLSLHDWVMVTDADCRPSSDQWLNIMVSCLKPSTDIVLGYAPFYDKQQNFINLISRYENFITGCFYLSFAMAGIPYMGVGRNMLFKKNVFLHVYDQVKNTNTISGDDDLFIQLAATRTNCEVCIDEKAFLYSESKYVIKDFLQQKSRHLATGFHYKKMHLLALIFYPLTFLILWLSYISLLVLQRETFVFATIILVFYLLIIGYVKTKATHILEFKSRIPILALDLFFLLYQIILVILPLKRNKKRW